jgi:hypothetical protein
VGKGSKNKKYSVKSMYDMMCVGDTGNSFSGIWKAKIPYKIKNFIWLVENNAILTKDNMSRRKWVGDTSCQFCDKEETISPPVFECTMARVIRGIIAQCIGANNIPANMIQYWEWVKSWLPGGGSVYTFGLAAVCWATWKTRNKACFGKIRVKHPVEILCYACALMKF